MNRIKEVLEDKGITNLASRETWKKLQYGKWICTE